jgi:hypothetical protein
LDKAESSDELIRKQTNDKGLTKCPVAIGHRNQVSPKVAFSQVLDPGRISHTQVNSLKFHTNLIDVIKSASYSGTKFNIQVQNLISRYTFSYTGTKFHIQVQNFIPGYQTTLLRH